jgi:hypothetical protein
MFVLGFRRIWLVSFTSSSFTSNVKLANPADSLNLVAKTEALARNRNRAASHFADSAGT